MADSMPSILLLQLFKQNQNKLTWIFDKESLKIAW